MRADPWLARTLDSLIGAFSPRRAVRRRHFRRMERDPDYRAAVLLALRARGYRNANSQGQTPWLSTDGRSADAELLWDLPKLRNRSREIQRDDPIGSGLLETLMRQTVGTGLRPQARTRTPEKNRRMEAVFRERAAHLDPVNRTGHGAHQRMVCIKRLEDGEVLVKRSIPSPAEPLVFETIEADRLATPQDALPLDPEGQIRDGVEKDRLGRPVAYWILRGHPGDFPAVSKTRPVNAAIPPKVLTQADFDRVPAEQIRHLKLALRPGQTRGTPRLHAVLQDLRDLDLLLLATLKRTQVAACFAAFIESTAEAPELFELTAEDYGYRLDQDLEPGMFFKLYPGEKVTTLNPNFPLPQLEPYVIILARRIGAAVGVSWQTVLRDWSQSNYSSARTQLLDDRQLFKIEQHALAEELLTWEWVSVLEDARLRGDPRLADCTDEDLQAVQWIANGWQWVDPEKEGRAIEIKLKLGLTTLRDEAAALGLDWEELQDQLLLEEKRWYDRREALGLPSAPFPIQVLLGGAASAQPASEEEEDLPVRRAA